MKRSLGTRFAAAVVGALLFNLVARLGSPEIAIGALGAYVLVLNERMADK